MSCRVLGKGFGCIPNNILSFKNEVYNDNDPHQAGCKNSRTTDNIPFQSPCIHACSILQKTNI